MECLKSKGYSIYYGNREKEIRNARRNKTRSVGSNDGADIQKTTQIHRRGNLRDSTQQAEQLQQRTDTKVSGERNQGVDKNTLQANIAKYLKSKGFIIYHGHRAKGVSNDTKELIAVYDKSRRGAATVSSTTTKGSKSNSDTSRDGANSKRGVPILEQNSQGKIREVLHSARGVQQEESGITHNIYNQKKL